MRPRTWPAKNMPKWLPFPAGFRLRVKQVIPTKMKEINGEYYDAFFNEEHETIYVNRNLKNARKWYVLAHEYGAAIEYWARWLVKKGIAKA